MFMHIKPVRLISVSVYAYKSCHIDVIVCKFIYICKTCQVISANVYQTCNVNKSVKLTSLSDNKKTITLTSLFAHAYKTCDVDITLCLCLWTSNVDVTLRLCKQNLSSWRNSAYASETCHTDVTFCSCIKNLPHWRNSLLMQIEHVMLTSLSGNEFQTYHIDIFRKPVILTSLSV